MADPMTFGGIRERKIRQIRQIVPVFILNSGNIRQSSEELSYISTQWAQIGKTTPIPRHFQGFITYQPSEYVFEGK